MERYFCNRFSTGCADFKTNGRKKINKRFKRRVVITTMSVSRHHNMMHDDEASTCTINTGIYYFSGDAVKPHTQLPFILPTDSVIPYANLYLRVIFRPICVFK